jgi:hypothetical protein
VFLDEAHLFLNKRIKDEYSIEVEIRKGKFQDFMGSSNNPYPDLALYVREANIFLKSNGFKCKLYKTT